MRKSQRIDKVDVKILTALQAAGRVSNLELAAKVGLSASPCHRPRQGCRPCRDPELRHPS
jgi:DNA-binding Lrp family transcriptional regulator